MTRLRVLLAHAYYRQRGGEDIVAEQEAALLEDHGHQVLRYSSDNRNLDETRPLTAALSALWSRRTTAAVTSLIHDFRPDIIHVHNTFPTLSPSLYWAAASRRIPIVQTLHNFRLLCPQAMLLREGSVCEQCIGRIPWRAVLHSCYRDSAAQSAVLASMLTMHRSLGTYRRKITRYIALNDFCRRKFVAGGLPAEKISVKPNFAAVPVPDPQTARTGALFAGRISEEKGIHCLLDALASLPTLQVEIVGDGPERSRVSRNPHVTLRSWLSQSELFAVMRRCAYLILPSIWYENSPRVLIEAFGNGLPVIASRLGALAELVDDGRTGLLFDPASPSDLARVLRWAEDHPEELREMGSRARHIYETRYSPERNYRQLLDIYRRTIESHYLENVA